MKILELMSCGSTNEEMKRHIRRMSKDSPLSPAIVSLEQTAGKGRCGRSFSSPYGKGLYASIPIELDALDDRVLSFMPLCSVCVCKTLDAICSAPLQIKWPNDVLCNGKKLCGILTELVQQCGRYILIIGIGINLTQTVLDFPQEIRDKAISLSQVCNVTTDPITLARLLIPEIEDSIKALPESKAEYLDYYRRHCISANGEINVMFSDNTLPRRATVLGITEDFCLSVKWDDGSCEILKTGEVSIR